MKLKLKEGDRMIHIKNVSKSFKQVKAIEAVNLAIKEGECTALIGPNGAGKSTLIDLIIRTKHPDTGSIEFVGADKENVGVLFQKTNFPYFVKVKELYFLFAHLYENVMSFQEFEHLTGFNQQQMNQYAVQLSGGQQRLLDFMLLLIGKPKILILDEPTSAMDAKTRRFFWERINQFKAAGNTILYTTHYIDEVERVADRVVILNKGKVTLDGTPNSIRQQLRTSTIYLPEKYEVLLKSNELIFSKQQGEIQIQTDNVELILHKLMHLDIDLNDIEIKKQSIEALLFEQEGEKTS